MVGITPKVDLAFKKIFAVEENKDLLISLINSIVGPQDQVSDVTLLNPYNPQDFKGEKSSIVDIKATNQDGKRFNIEIQISNDASYDKRALFYWAKLYTEQLKASEDFSTLSKAIGIHILNFLSIPDVEKYHNVFHIAEKETGVPYFKDLELHTIELKKFSDDSKEELSDIVLKVKSALDMWLAFLTRHDLLIADNLPKELNDPNLKKAIGVLDVMNFTAAEREAYEEHLKWLRVESCTLKNHEQIGEERGELRGIEKGIKIGEEKGRVEGMEKGRVEGMKIGEEKGREEGMKENKILTAKAMLSAGLDINIISKVTGIVVAELKELETSNV